MDMSPGDWLVVGIGVYAVLAAILVHWIDRAPLIEWDDPPDNDYHIQE